MNKQDKAKVEALTMLAAAGVVAVVAIVIIAISGLLTSWPMLFVA